MPCWTPGSEWLSRASLPNIISLFALTTATFHKTHEIQPRGWQGELGAIWRAVWGVLVFIHCLAPCLLLLSCSSPRLALAAGAVSSSCCCPGQAGIVPSCSPGHLLAPPPTLLLPSPKSTIAKPSSFGQRPLTPSTFGDKSQNPSVFRGTALLWAAPNSCPASHQSQVKPSKTRTEFQPLCPQDVTLNFNKGTFTLKYQLPSLLLASPVIRPNCINSSERIIYTQPQKSCLNLAAPDPSCILANFAFLLWILGCISPQFFTAQKKYFQLDLQSPIQCDPGLF